MAKPRPVQEISGDLEEAFHSRYERQRDGCWNWTGYRTDKGYGRLVFRGRAYRAHRLSFALANGKDPGHLLVCHACDNRLCVNPEHLWLGTSADNTRDMISKGRQPRHFKCGNIRPGYCARCGHHRTDDHVASDGQRRCRNCQRTRDANLSEERRARKRKNENARRMKARLSERIAKLEQKLAELKALQEKSA